jgi:putative membrane protein
MFYNYYFGGMYLVWWVIWIVFLCWIFVLPYRVPFQRYKKDSPLDILQRRFASGEITNEEYQEKKKIIESDLGKKS